MGGIQGVVEDSVAHPPRARRVWGYKSSSPSIRTQMVALVLVAVVPLLTFSAYLVLRSASHEQEIMASTVRERTQASAAAVDHELGVLRARLFVLAASEHLQATDFATFHTEAREAMKEDGLEDHPDRSLRSGTGQYRGPLGGEAAGDKRSRCLRGILETGRPNISDLTTSAVTGEPIIAINVPVFHNALANLHAQHGHRAEHTWDTEPSRPAAGLDCCNFGPPGRDDRQEPRRNRFVGQMGRPVIIERFRASDDGWFRSITRDGIPAYNAFAHVKLAGWAIAAGIPEDALFAPARRSTMIVVLVGG